jgi:hypothetical protein
LGDEDGCEDGGEGSDEVEGDVAYGGVASISTLER